ncbi:hypothetical protein ACN6K9_006342 [Streptomyces sp. SAS_267]|uniref:hypothetical protein n=1 Tax=unclassified Streptomyces TaxID=2593676 RepID=UPI0034E4A5DB
MNERELLHPCPYCEYKGLFRAGEGHDTWECGACERAFSFSFLRLLGLVALGVGQGATHEGR